MESIKLLLLNGYFLIHDPCYVTVIPVALRDNVVAVIVMEVVNTADRRNMNALRSGHTQQHVVVNHV